MDARIIASFKQRYKSEQAKRAVSILGRGQLDNVYNVILQKSIAWIYDI